MILPGILAASQASTPPATFVRQYFAAESLGAVSNTDALVWTAQGVSLAATTDAAARYAVIWCFEVLCTNGNLNAEVQITEGAAAVETVAYRPSSGTEWCEQGGFFLHIGAGASVTWTMNLRISTNVFGPASASVRNARIMVLRLETQDEYDEDLSPQGNGTHSFTDAVTLAFTPAAPGSYLMLGFGLLSDVPTAASQVRLFDGSNGTATIQQGHAALSAQLATVAPWIKPALSGAQSISLQWNFGNIKSARILALRLDGFTHAYRAVLAGDDQGDETGFTDALSLSRTIGERDFLALAVWQPSLSGGGQVIETRFVDAIGVVNTNTMAPSPNGTGESKFAARIGAYAAGRRSWSIQRRTPNPATDAVVRDEATIVLLQLN